MASGETRWLLSWTSYNTAATRNPVLGTIPANAVVVRGYVHVITAFNGGSANEITIGYDSDVDAHVTAIATNTTGVKSLTLGVGIGRDATARSVEVYATYSGAAPTAGRALCGIEYFTVPPPPAA